MIVNATKKIAFKMDLSVPSGMGDLVTETKTWTSRTDIIYEVKILNPNSPDVLTRVSEGLD